MPLGDPNPSRSVESETEDAENVAPRPADESTSVRQPFPNPTSKLATSSTPLSENSLHASASAASKGPPASKTKLKVTVRNWNGVATWLFEIFNLLIIIQKV